MREDYKIFVEGIADKRFLEQLIEYHFGYKKEDGIVVTGGYTNLLSADTENTYLNQMNRNSDDGGINLVIFDADEDREKEAFVSVFGRNAEIEHAEKKGETGDHVFGHVPFMVRHRLLARGDLELYHRLRPAALVLHRFRRTAGTLFCKMEEVLAYFGGKQAVRLFPAASDLCPGDPGAGLFQKPYGAGRGAHDRQGIFGGQFPDFMGRFPVFLWAGLDRVHHSGGVPFAVWLGQRTAAKGMA